MKDSILIAVQFQRVKHTFDSLKDLNSGKFKLKPAEGGLTQSEQLERAQAEALEALNEYLFELKEQTSLRYSLLAEEIKYKIHQQQNRGSQQSDHFVH